MKRIVVAAVVISLEKRYIEGNPISTSSAHASSPVSFSGIRRDFPPQNNHAVSITKLLASPNPWLSSENIADIFKYLIKTFVVDQQ